MNPSAPKFPSVFALALLIFLAACDGSPAGADGDRRFVISPPYAPAPEVVTNDAVPQGTLHMFTMDSTDSAVFPADVLTGERFEREVAVYVPAQYEAGAEAPFMVVQDGVTSYRFAMVPALDAMIASGELPVMVAVFVEPGPNGGPTEGERSFEYDSVSEAYLTFVETELLPRVARETGVTLTDDPDGRAAVGGSSGGAAAFTMGWLRPDLYRRILTFSGSFTALQANAEHPDGAWEYHDHLIAESPAKPLRVALEAGEHDFDMNGGGEHRRNWVEANEAMADALEAKGYAYRYVYAEDADHMDYAVMEQTLPDTLRWLWEGYAGQ